MGAGSAVYLVWIIGSCARRVAPPHNHIEKRTKGMKECLVFIIVVLLLFNYKSTASLYCIPNTYVENHGNVVEISWKEAPNKRPALSIAKDSHLKCTLPPTALKALLQKGCKYCLL